MRLTETWCLCHILGAMACRHFPVPGLQEKHGEGGTEGPRSVLRSVDSWPLHEARGEEWGVDFDGPSRVPRAFWLLGRRVWDPLPKVGHRKYHLPNLNRINDHKYHYSVHCCMMKIIEVWFFWFFECRYEKEGKGRKTIKAQQLWYAVIESQTETGTPYMLYKDHCNRKSNQQNLGTIKCSNLCTEIVEYSSPEEVRGEER